MFAAAKLPLIHNASSYLREGLESLARTDELHEARSPNGAGSSANGSDSGLQLTGGVSPGVDGVRQQDGAGAVDRGLYRTLQSLQISWQALLQGLTDNVREL